MSILIKSVQRLFHLSNMSINYTHNLSRAMCLANQFSTFFQVKCLGFLAPAGHAINLSQGSIYCNLFRKGSGFCQKGTNRFKIPFTLGTSICRPLVWNCFRYLGVLGMCLLSNTFRKKYVSDGYLGKHIGYFDKMRFLSWRS